MDFDTAKENIQPLASGRNAERLETALNAESDQEVQEKLLQERKDFEHAIQTYDGDDPLQLWYEYIEWIEQSYPKSGKDSQLHELISKCLCKFEKDERFFQDRRMLKLYIKYIDSEPNPHQFYELLYKNGIGTMLADLYICWAHYYDYCDNFQKAEEVYQKGLDARAQPIEQLEEAHKNFGFSMSQRFLHKDESSQQKFRSAMDEKRLAMTSLRAHKHRHVGSIRTGPAIKSYNPGRVEQRTSQRATNGKVQVYEDENGAAASEAPTSVEQPSTSVVQSIMNSAKKQENLREPGPWNNAKIKSSSSVTRPCSQQLPFSILEDDAAAQPPPIPLPDSENNYNRGIKLPPRFERKNLPQDDFSFPLHRDDEPSKKTMPGYDKFHCFPAKDKCYSLEEFVAYKWFKKQKIENNFTREQDKVWECGFDIPMRLPPHFARKNAKQDNFVPLPFNIQEAVNEKRKFGFDIDLIYTQKEEFSLEELLQSKWINGDLPSQRQHEMELTCNFERREEVYVANTRRRSIAIGGRKSILPRKSIDASNSPQNLRRSRQSFVPTLDPLPSDEPETHTENVATGAIRKVSLPKRKSVHFTVAEAFTPSLETASPPTLRRKMHDEDNLSRSSVPAVFGDYEDKEPAKLQTDDGENVFKTPKLPLAKSSIFQDDEFENCNTQTFNFFLKSQSVSTPNAPKTRSLAQNLEQNEVPRKELDFNLSEEIVPAKHSAANDQHELVKQPFACRSVSSVSSDDYANQNGMEILHQKLATIMETTEDATSTATMSSKSSSAEDFDYTKHTNQQSLAASTYRQVIDTRNQTSLSVTRASASLASVSIATKVSETTRNPTSFAFDVHQDSVVQTEADRKSLKSNNSDAYSDQSVLYGFNSTLKSAKNNHPPIVTAAENVEVIENDQKESQPQPILFDIYEDAPTAPLAASFVNDQRSVMVPNETSVVASKTSTDKSIFEVIETPTTDIQTVYHNKDKTLANMTSDRSQFILQLSEQPIMPSATAEKMLNNPSKLINASTSGLKYLPQKGNNKSIYKMPREDTPSILCMNFADERTETLTDIIKFKAVDKSIQPFCVNATVHQPEESLYMPPIPDESVAGFIPQEDMLSQSAVKPAEVIEEVGKSSVEKPVFTIYCDNTQNLTKAAVNETLGANNMKDAAQFNDESVFEVQSEDTVPITLPMNAMFTKNQTLTAAEGTIHEKSISQQIKSISQHHQTAKEDTFHQASNFSQRSMTEHKINVTTAREANDRQKSTFNTFSDVNESTSNKSRVNTTVKDRSAYATNSLLKQSMMQSNASNANKYSLLQNPVQNADGLQQDDIRKSIPAKKDRIDDELLGMINSPVYDEPFDVKRVTNSFAKKQPSRLADKFDESSLVVPIKEMSITTHQKKSMPAQYFPDENNGSFTTEVPHTALFSLNMEAIKNSTLLTSSPLPPNARPNMLKEKSLSIQEESVSIPSETAARSSLNYKSMSNNLQQSMSKTRLTTKPQDDLDEFYEMAKDSDSLNISGLPLRNDEFFLFDKPKELVIGEPRTIRPSQFPTSDPNGTLQRTSVFGGENKSIMLGEPRTIRPSQFPASDPNGTLQTSKFGNSISHQLKINDIDQSVVVIEDTEDISNVSKGARSLNNENNQTNVREYIKSPFKNHFNNSEPSQAESSDPAELNPFDPQLQNALLEDLDFNDYISDLNYVTFTDKVRVLQAGSELEIQENRFKISKLIGKGTFGYVYSGNCLKTNKKYAFKQERPPNLWEFYISIEIVCRIQNQQILPGFQSMDWALIGYNQSVYVSEYSEYGSLFDICNHHKSVTCRPLEEAIAMIFAEQMLLIIDHLHAANIIHGDLKPDNFLLMKKLKYGSDELVLKLIDFGHSIDLKFYKTHQTFTTKLETKNFICTEMMEDRPWKHQIDLFCLASTIYSLLCGKYMNVRKQTGSSIRPYVLEENLPSHLSQIWENILYALINVRDCNSLPNLQNLRLPIREAIASNEKVIVSKINKFNSILDERN